MKNKTLVAVVFTATFSHVSVADNFTGDWNDGSALSSITDSAYPAVAWYISTRISHDSTGEKRIYITIMKNIDKKTTSACKKEDINIRGERVIFKINNQNIKGIKYCKTFYDSEDTYYEITPETDLGDKFLIGTMRSSKRSVTFKYDTITAEISTTGFSKSWINFGGNAL